MNRPQVEIFTDGACSPNPGYGGWGAILIAPGFGGLRRELSGFELDSTSNRMELTAAIRALQALKRPSRVKLTTDSQYLCQAFRAGWLAGWKRNGWLTASKKPVKNQDLWQELDRLTDEHDVSWAWVKGHAEHPENERADALAVAAREQLREETPGRGGHRRRRR